MREINVHSLANGNDIFFQEQQPVLNILKIVYIGRILKPQQKQIIKPEAIFLLCMQVSSKFQQIQYMIT